MNFKKNLTFLFVLFSMQAFSQNCGTVDRWEYSATPTSATHSDYEVIFDGLSTSNGVKSIHNFIILCDTDTLYTSSECYNTGPSNSGPITDTFTFNAPTCNGFQLVLIYSGRTSGACGGTTCRLNVTASNPVAVPVSWLDFNAVCNQEEVVLKWSTAMELNNSGFEVQQHIEGDTWEVVGFVAAEGSSNEIQDYTFTMDKALNHSGVYRLKQIDYDGQSDYSEITKLDCSNFDVVLYPNPSSDIIQFSSEVEQLVVSNIHGVEMIVNDDFTSTVNVSELEEGIYFLKYKVNNVLYSKRLSVDRSK